MKKYLLFVLVFPFLIVSCVEDDIWEPIPSETEQTVFMYLPWSSNLTTHFQQNITDFETALQDNILGNSRLLVFFSSSATEAVLFEMKYERGKNVRTILKEYENPAFTTAGGITSILNDVKSFAPAGRYAMIIGAHGMGWLPVEREELRASKSVREKEYWEYEGVPLTRYFGGTTADCQTDIADLADGIAGAGIRMDYILFDDCYMSSIEVAYDLKDVTDYLIASPTEVLAYGFPYHKIGRYLIGDVDLEGICNGFYEYYEQYQYPYGTIGVTVCAELDNLASVMRDINQKFTFDPALLETIQTMSGYSPEVFFDFGHYVANLCTDAELLSLFERQLERTVPPNLRLHTRSYYAMSRGAVEINAYTGVTTSDPSISAKAVAKTKTAWYRATHE